MSPNSLVASDTSITGTVPNAPGGTATVTVTNPDGQTATSSFTYTGPAGPPSISSITPTTGGTLGDTAVTIAGSGFVKGAAISFGAGNSPPDSATVSSDGTSITARTPVGVYGLVDVTVTNPGGGEGTLKHGFTFTTAAQPTITSISPSSGPGGTQVTITGTGFAQYERRLDQRHHGGLRDHGGQPLLPLAATDRRRPCRRS